MPHFAAALALGVDVLVLRAVRGPVARAFAHETRVFLLRLVFRMLHLDPGRAHVLRVHCFHCFLRRLEVVLLYECLIFFVLHLDYFSKLAKVSFNILLRYVSGQPPNLNPVDIPVVSGVIGIP